jgi:hypothetical protein
MVGWFAVTAVALMMWAGCATIERIVYPNEIVRHFNSFSRGEGGGVFVMCVEKTTTSTNNALKVSDVCVLSGDILQIYRMEGHKVFNCHWTDRLYDWDWDKSAAIEEKLIDMFEVFQQSPNKLEQNDTLPKPLANGSSTKVTRMGWGLVMDKASWSHWDTWQRGWTQEDVPAEIETFRQTAEQAVSVPKHKKNTVPICGLSPCLRKKR